jgi:diaminopimelate decarboxylase
MSPVPDAIAAGDLFPDTTEVSRSNVLSIGGCDVAALADEFGTPLYVFDEETIRTRARAFQRVLERSYRGGAGVSYASKAYAAPWLLRLLEAQGLSLDVVSGGELHAAEAAGFPAERIFLHGNNKGEDELAAALDLGVGRIVVDNLDEIAALGKLTTAVQDPVPVLLRVAPGVDADTHAHFHTGGLDSKFGLGVVTGQAEAGVRAILEQPGLDLRGLHAHIGSQITDVEPYRSAVDRVLAFAASMQRSSRFELRELSPGGGFGVRYTPADDPVDPFRMVEELGQIVMRSARRHGIDPLPHMTIEPGRSLIAAAGVALYRVGSVKAIPGGRTYVAVDGGMADNIRPTAYGAEYTAVLANRVADAVSGEVAIAGKYCETGDILIQGVSLPRPRIGDLVAVPVSGAYQPAMWNNYNLALRPPVVVVANAAPRLVRRRETYEDLLRMDVIERDRGADPAPVGAG